MMIEDNNRKKVFVSEVALFITLFICAWLFEIFGMISTIHLGFASRAYFAEMKRNSRATDESM